MKKLQLSGLGTALVTPFKDGEVDYESYSQLVGRQIRAGVDFLVPLGTTGETPCLDDSEKIKLLEVTAELVAGTSAATKAAGYAAGGSMPIVAGVGTNSLKATLSNMKLLENHGVDAFLVVVPYYNKPTQKGQYEYFKALAGETDKPIIIYNVPGRTGANMKAETTLHLAEIDNIVAAKEASGNLEQIFEVIKGAPEGFAVLSGNDDQTLDIMRAGGAGIISVASNVAPDLMVKFVAAVRAGASGAADSALWTEAEKLNEKLMPLFKGCFIESNPMPAKAALAAMGLIENELRLPLVPCEPSTMAAITEVIRALGLI